MKIVVLTKYKIYIFYFSNYDNSSYYIFILYCSIYYIKKSEYNYSLKILILVELGQFWLYIL